MTFVRAIVFAFLQHSKNRDGQICVVLGALMMLVISLSLSLRDLNWKKNFGKKKEKRINEKLGSLISTLHNLIEEKNAWYKKCKKTLFRPMCQAIKFSSYDGILLIRLISSECDINFLSLVSFSNILQDQLSHNFFLPK